MENREEERLTSRREITNHEMHKAAHKKALSKAALLKPQFFINFSAAPRQRRRALAQALANTRNVTSHFMRAFIIHLVILAVTFNHVSGQSRIVLDGPRHIDTEMRPLV